MSERDSIISVAIVIFVACFFSGISYYVGTQVNDTVEIRMKWECE